MHRQTNAQAEKCVGRKVRRQKGYRQAYFGGNPAFTIGENMSDVIEMEIFTDYV